jgi:hypothetical protein
MENLDYLIRYNNARYNFLEAINSPDRKKISLEAQTEFIMASDDIQSRGIVYAEMGSPERAPFYNH